MKSVAKFAFAALLVASPVTAIAQDAAAPAASTTDPMTTANYGSLISSFNAGKMADLATFTSTSTVHCVKVSALKGDASADATALDKALTKNAAQVTSLKTAVGANADLKAKLEASTCPIDQVVAVTTEADGSFVVYIDDRP